MQRKCLPPEHLPVVKLDVRYVFSPNRDMAQSDHPTYYTWDYFMHSLFLAAIFNALTPPFEVPRICASGENGLSNFSGRSEPKNPRDDLVVYRDLKGDFDSSIHQVPKLLSGVPYSLTYHMGGPRSETNLDFLWFPSHHVKSGLQIVVKIEILRQVKGFVQDLETLYPVHSKSSDCVSEVAKTNKIKPAVHCPNLIRINLPF